MGENREPSVKKDRQIQNEIVILAREMDTLGVKIAALDSRLMPALRIEPPSENKDSEDENTLVTFATDIRQVRHSIEAQTTVLNRILDQLEI